MGMYDYINKNGDQVKCFYVPCITIHDNKDTNGKEVSFYASGGQLKGYAEGPVPFMTPYYNYGHTFAIMEFHLLPSSMEPVVHIIRDKCFVETFDISALPDDYDLPKNVIDKYGQWYNIKSAQELKQFIAEDREVKKRVRETEEVELAKVGLKVQLPAFDKSRPAEDYIREFKIREEIDNKIHAEIQKPFMDKWWNGEHDSKLDIIGFVLADYDDVISRPDERVQRTEEDWKLIFTQAVEYLEKEGYPTPLHNYFQWCEKEGIEIDRHKATELFSKYTGGRE